MPKIEKILRSGFTAVLLFVVNVVFAYDFEVDGFYCNHFTKGVSVEVTFGDTPYSGDVIIPSEVTYEGNTYSVESIGMSAFADCADLTSVSIPNSVLYLQGMSFIILYLDRP